MSTAKDTVGPFLDGQRDCKAGVSPQSNDPCYLSGYEYQYFLEEQATGQQIEKERHHETR